MAVFAEVVVFLPFGVAPAIDLADGILGVSGGGFSVAGAAQEGEGDVGVKEGDLGVGWEH